MKSALALLALATTATALPASYVENNAGLLWEAFKAEHGKSYSAAEEPRRMAIFKANMMKAAAMEAGSKSGARFGVNRFTDMAAEEFKVYHSLNVPNVERNETPEFSESELLLSKKKSKDWRQGGAVTQVKNQGQCGSCWSFSTTGGAEGANFMANGELVSASEQQFVSCDTTDMGCSGGLQEQAYEWVINSNNGVIVTEADYGYVSGAGNVPSCKRTGSMETAATIKSYKMVQQSEDAIAATLIKSGPVPIAIDATAWQTYQGGIMDNCGGFQMDHAVLAVGVTPDYWIVKNSWGTSWGESGYIRLQRGTNQCLISQHAVMPSV
jgi:C1A family cysteine protease